MRSKTQRPDDPSGLNEPNSERKPDVVGAGVALQMEFVGGKQGVLGRGREELPGTSNYFVGSDPSQWRTNLPTYGRIEYLDVYPGIDVAYYGENHVLEYDFIVSPGADPASIKLRFTGAEEIELGSKGELIQEVDPKGWTGKGSLKRRVAERAAVV